MSLIASIENNHKENRISYFLVQTIRSLFLILSLISNLSFNIIFSINNIFLISIILKTATAPTHNWIISITLNRTWITVILLTTLQKLMPVLILEIRMCEISSIIIFFCIATLTTGSLLNISRNSLKIIFVFSSIRSMSWILIRIFTNTTLIKIFLFIYWLSLFIIFYQHIKKTQPNLLIFLILLRTRGIPPLIGFFPKLLLSIKIIEINIKIILISILLFSLIELFIYLRTTYLSIFNISSISLLKYSKTKFFYPWITFNFIVFLFFL